MFSKSEILNRPYWNVHLIKKLLQNPDETIFWSSGRVMKHQYAVDRVKAAETTGIFQKHVRDADSYRKSRDEDIETLKAGLEKAVEMDFRMLVIPVRGNFLEVYAWCERQFHMYNTILKTSSYTYSASLFGRNGSYADPRVEICRRIAKARPDLAFEAGMQYSSIHYGIGTISELSIELASVEAEEAELGEPVYIIRT